MSRLRKWTLGCGLGCLVPLLVLVGFVISVSMSGNKTIEARQVLEETLGTADDFTPWVDGRIPDDRIERYLAVRRALADRCEVFSEAAAGFRGMQELDDLPAEEDPGTRVAVGHVWEAIRGMSGIVFNLNSYLLQRNQLLMEKEMSLAEWTFLHVVVYYAYLEHDPRPFALEDDQDTARIYEQRVRGEVLAAIERHLANPHSASRNPDHARWFGELRQLRDNLGRVPFRGAVPARVAGSLAPFRADLEALWCPATDEIDLSITAREGLAFDHQ